jgi:isoamylase
MRFIRAVRRIRLWIAASWRNFVTAVLIGMAAAVSAAAGWEQHHHLQWLVAAAVIAALGGLAQLSHQARPDLSQGKAVRLGAWPTKDKKGVNFAVFSKYARAVDLCLFDDAGSERRIALSLLPSTPHVWHGYVRGAGAGQRYGYRVSGEYQPADGHRFNPAKLLLDPYARAIEGKVDWAGPVFGYVPGADDIAPDTRDSAPYMPRSVVVDDAFEWGDDHHPSIPWTNTVMYDVHIRGFTQQHPDIPERQRGTYAAMGSPPVISYLKKLGVTTLQLMSVYHFVSEQALVRQGLTNYWGYNPIGYFAPEASYSASGTAGEQVQEFKTMVRNLHAADIEVTLDAVFNHTAEGDHLGPHLCFRGIDNRAYYRLDHDQRRYRDYSGCGNSLNMRDPQVLALIIDSLRYWVEEMHVDGFRFELANAVAQNLYDVGHLNTFFDMIRDDPVISRIKLIAEPWDVGADGEYEIDNFPSLWGEFNDRYRDAVRSFWRGAAQPREELACRLTGSVDLCRSDGHSPGTSINFVTCHDGFTLHDLVSYNEKHNKANGADNHDGIEFNDSWNCGAEGPTDDPEIERLRERQKRNFMTSLLLSAGVPMLLAGDELGRTQQGNNNPYCQDNEVSWLKWELDERSEALLQFTKQLIALRAGHPVFRRRKPFDGRQIRNSGMKDVGWFGPDGTEMNEKKWRSRNVYALGMFLNGQAVFDRALQSERIADDSFLLLFNNASKAVRFMLPGPPWATHYEPIINTAHILPGAAGIAVTCTLKAGDTIHLESRSSIVIRAAMQPRS